MDGLLIVTSQQEAGRGQRGNTWEAQPDQNLTFSLVLQPSFLLAHEQFQLNMAISMGIFDFLTTFSLQNLHIKWPNDIYCQNKKMGGILIENFLKGNRIGNSIIGIGLNINQKEFAYPTATSLQQLTNKNYKLPMLLELLAAKIEAQYISLRTQGPSRLKQYYLAHLYWYQEEHLFQDLRDEQMPLFKGQILGINPYGQLVIQRNNTLDYFSFQEIKFIE